MKILWQLDAWEEYISWQSEDKKTLKRINQLIQDISCSFFEGTGKPESLKGDLKDLWSRRIDEKNRLIYRIKNDDLEIIACKGHYEKETTSRIKKQQRQN